LEGLDGELTAGSGQPQQMAFQGRMVVDPLDGGMREHQPCVPAPVRGAVHPSAGSFRANAAALASISAHESPPGHRSREHRRARRAL